jgi:D-alanyl-D-alanine carboxypeptidase
MQQKRLSFLNKYLYAVLIISVLNVFPSISKDEILLEDSLAIDFMNVSPAQVYRETFLPVITSKDSAEVIGGLQVEIDRILNRRYVRNAQQAIAVYSLDKKEYYYAKNIDVPMTPASTTKLVTTFTAYDLLGSEHRVFTKIFTDAESIQDSVLNGNIYIVGKGDAMFTVQDLECMAEDIEKLGIKKINGNVYADGSFFDGITSRWEYSGDDDEVQAMPPVTALSIEDNKATIVVSSGSRAGKYVNVNILPQSEIFAKWVTAKVRGYKRSKSSLMNEDTLGLLYGHLQDINEYEKAGDSYPQLMPASSWRSIRVRSNISEKTGKQLFTVSGYLYPNKTVSYKHYIEEPELSIAGALKARIEAGGIEVTGDCGVKELGDSENLHEIYTLSEFSRKLSDIIENTNKFSNNYYAENLFKMIGAYNRKHQLNVDGARELIADRLEQHSIPFDKCKLNDGSGLSRRNLLTAETLIRLLETADTLKMKEEFLNSLSIAGVDGTLRKRMKYTGAENNLKAKTGTLRNVSALAGYITTLEGERLCFAFLFKGYGVSSYKDAEDEIGKAMSEFIYYSSEMFDE